MGLSRSEQMSRIRGRDTSPERLLRSALWRAGLRFRLHTRTTHGRPDVVFPRHKVAVFIDGCFWHGCPKHYVRPRTRDEFWSSKLRENVERDRRQTLLLEEGGWRVCRFWEHQIFESLAEVVEWVRQALQDGEWTPSASWRVVQVIPQVGEGDMEQRWMEELRDATETRTVVGRRSTKKWKRP
ncbi:very short patch repair protein [Myxococcus xanthus DK 1622]|uniref:Very short patch repair protein n=1 Tax=Myxococcus xanthus (strain DK1622) TaxID=246197 RepID=Q1D6D6_MYXXD|nr:MULTISPECIES: very short patch repair endonuclease [Myxococcus]ABF87499.1 very short patch repair protein [Myxococcus xanthus DK 1622]NOJ56036.1 very short patch repair endonuclease [Myxococcus xanthus]QPM83005.1 very short patch repair endonuclease [Myxococcus xanthus]QVW65311.1 very short patch repair endonuclease [Myxococcus xanthus DZ2]UEO01622.1 very short patch repair endonuclease [Myxococcus xanthus DZ2]